MSSAEQQHVESHVDDFQTNEVEVAQGGSQADTAEAAPPVLPAPEVDVSFSMESIFEASSQQASELEKIEKLKEENDRLAERLKEMQDRLSRAEKKSEEIEAKRRSQMLR